MLKEKWAATSLLAVWMWSTAAVSAPAAPSLAEMVESAISRNPGIELAEAERNVGKALERKSNQVFAGDFTANVKYQTDTIGSDLGYREWEGGVEVPLWLPGQADSYAREADQTLLVSDVMQSARHLEIAGEVRERLWSAVIMRSESEQAQVALDAAKELFNDVRRRVEAGELPRTDLLLAEQAMLEREEAAQQAQTRARQAAQRFTRFTGFDLPEQPTDEQAQTVDSIKQDHPALLLSHGRVEQARARRNRVSAERRTGPSVWVGGKSAKAMAGSDYDSAVGVEISMPFGTGGHTAPALAEAEAALTQAQVDHAAAQIALEDKVAETGLELDRAKTALTQTERRSRLAAQSLKLSRRAFSLGETDLIRLLQVQADALAARHDLELRQLELGQAVARLNQAQGVIPQ
ncbi:TolC family protein [Thiosocius teredinicola]|uniref:TolC family protein n=1 Tax=Thiosocius teredinicola TaxID=1973002 RepID=UPI0013DE4B05